MCQNGQLKPDIGSDLPSQMAAHRGFGTTGPHWKGLALARVQVGLAIVMLNTLKWYKIRHARLEPMTLTTAA